ncbi:unnamed protein product [Microthlaspi erraticum]|uniref:Arabidopsis retrotransposon Orf1 C-terminal domain-containing protein n=1 Tax=Microthlaspi erraticum TaxID=1685480 RepID=A0A6D2J699_9BRAS|nr:unnamed protein product [Microthlaspi erraticum]
MEEAEAEQEEDELPMYQEHYNALFSMDFVETKYPHDDTMRILESLRMWSWCSRTCNWPSSSHRMESYKELTCSLRSVWVHYGEGNQWNIKEEGTPKSWATIAEGYSSSRSKAAQIRSPVLRYVHKALANTFFARKATGQSMREK